ncbi:protein of unknown function DUF885 [Isosphaera pallida ATCC 43644]|uniref:DUF885 domain-containing protein n=2 Tax=Isosphaera pallida TaxID=128 RepID=E8QXJ2_ISOPI|nr:protein of unknown function DUF885 [Isosphaera pallida ATCC 43644]
MPAVRWDRPMSNATETETDQRLTEWFDAYLERVFEDSPTAATRAGDHRFDDRLDELSAQAFARRLERDRRALADLETSIPFDKLSPDGQIDFQILHHHLKREIWLAETFPTWRTDPRVYVAIMTESLYGPLTQATTPREHLLPLLERRMAAIPAVVKAARANLTAETPRVFAETGLLQAKGAVRFFESDLLDLAGCPNDPDSTFAQAARACAQAARELVAFLENDLLPQANGEWRIGPERFAVKLHNELDAGMTADEVIAEARAEADKVVAEMAVIARQLWPRLFPGNVPPPDDPPGRAELIRAVLEESSKNHGSTETLVEDVRATVQTIKTFIRNRDILRLPEPDRCDIREMPEFLRGFSVAYLNPAPPLDPQGRSEYAVSPPPADWTPERVESFFREYNPAMLQILTIHEAYPGHYVQLEYSNRHPSKIRRILSSGVFAEGWAVYCEQMMLDLGFGDGDLVLRLNQLKFYLRAVVNAILDHDMHAGTLTDEQAMDLLMNTAFQSEGEAVGKVIRAKLSSCQLSTYFVGRVAFHRLRQTIQREQGERFDLGRYHEAVLDHGTIPVKFLPDLVRQRLRRPR